MKKLNSSKEDIKYSLSKTLSLIEELLNSDKYISSVIDASNSIIESLQNQKCIYLAGNGGSAAHSQHFAAELVSRFNFDRNPLPAIALTTDSSILTAVSNDYGYEKVFERQLSALGKSGDIFIGFSTSGNSQNIINAFSRSHEMNVLSIGICGQNGIKDVKPNIEILIPSANTPLIQEMHGITSHLICDIVEKSIFSKN